MTPSMSVSRYGGEYARESHLANTRLALNLLGGPAGFARFHSESEDSPGVLEADRMIKRFTDAQALELALSCFGDADLGTIKALGRDDRDRKLRELRRAGLTIRQIQRLTGVSHGSISNACSLKVDQNL